MAAVHPAPSANRFVVVDDSKDVRDIVTRVLHRLHPEATVEAAAGAREALGLLTDAGKGDGLVIVSDYDMGRGPTGTELLAEVALRWPLARRVLFTGHRPEDIVRTGAAPDAVLSKDRGMVELREYFA